MLIENACPMKTRQSSIVVREGMIVLSIESALIREKTIRADDG